MDVALQNPLDFPLPATGRCQCGQAQYRLNGQPLTLFTCHCTDCQRQSSSAFGMALWVHKADVQLTQGELKEWVREMPSGRKMSCRFCPSCGTRIFHQVLGQNETLSIKPGTLDDTSWLRPAAHIWTRSRQPWIQLDPATLQYPGNPVNFDELMAAWHHPKNP